MIGQPALDAKFAVKRIDITMSMTQTLPTLTKLLDWIYVTIFWKKE